jgi:DNA-directed RNA polymerase subunit RPC12/RpoP
MTIYQCALCGIAFNSDRSEEEAESEYERDFGHLHLSPSERAIVCDDCYIILTALEGVPDDRIDPRSNSH